MSYDLTVFVKNSFLSSSSDLVRGAALSDLVLELDDSLSVKEVRGYLPCVLGGVKTGFEIFVSEVSESEIEDYREDLESSGMSVVGDRYYDLLVASDLSITLVSKGEQELEAARLLATGLQSMGAAVLDPQIGHLTSSSGETIELR